MRLLKICAAINKETPPGAMLLGALVRVTRFERAISTSQKWRGTSSATPGYSVLSYYTTPQAKIKDFPVCGQSCGQSRFSARFRDPAKSRKCPYFKAFRASTSQVVDGVGTTPKPRALPTALHPGNCLSSDSFHSIVYFERDCKYSSPVIRYFSEQNCF